MDNNELAATIRLINAASKLEVLELQSWLLARLMELNDSNESK